MTLKAMVARLGAREDFNFLLTNRIPRAGLTRLIGRVSKVRQPLVARASIAAWRFFCDVDLRDAADTRFASLHDGFIRRLKPGARAIDADPAVIASPCDAIVGAHGAIQAGQLHQIKGFPYTLADLLGDDADAAPFANGSFVTLRLTAGMYHRFHAPADLTVERVRYIAGDTWNVNPIALKRIEKLYCKNERAPISVRLAGSDLPLMLVPVAAILVASIRLPWFDAASVRDGGERAVACAHRFAKGEEMGWFEHGSTILLLAPPGMRVADGIAQGQPIRMGEALLRTD